MEQPRELRQLFDACTQGNLDVVNALLDSGLSVNATDEDDVTALQLAAANGQEQVVRLLLVRGAAVDQANLAGWTPLLQAARNGHTAVAALLIQNHANVHAQTCYGAGIACLAARSGNLATCRLLDGAGISFALVSDPVVHDVSSTVEMTPLVVAAHLGHDSVVKHLLLSADVNYPVKPTEVTALMGAAVGGHVSTARLLVENGKANVDAADINNKCSLDYSIAQDKRQVKEYLEIKTTRCCYPSAKNTSPDIIEAVKCGNYEQVQDILEGDILQRDACVPQDGATPLMFSAMLGHFYITKLLIEKGCNVNAQDIISGWTALMQAIFHGRKEVAIYLIHAGANVTIPAKSGCTAFDMASIIGDVDTELYRLIAARAMPVVVPQQMRISVRAHASSMDGVNHIQQKTGMKAWWSRISKRFHNLKQPENNSSDRNEATETLNDTTLRNPTSTALSANDDFLKSLTINPLASVFDAGTGEYQNTTDHTVKNDVLYSLNASGMIMRGSSSTTLKSVVPPVFPSPSFHIDRTSKMPPASLRKPLSNHANSHGLSLTRSVSSGVKLLKNQHSTLNLVNRVASPPPRVQFAKRPAIKMQIQADVSPSASCDAATLGAGSGDAAALPRSKGVISSESSSTLTAGSDNNGKTSPSVELLRSHCKKIRSPVDTKSNNSQSSQLLQCSVHNFSAADPSTAAHLSSVRNDSGIGTELAHHEITVKHNTAECDQADLGGVLQKLSLECYQPIFEEQEVDMEAFLTLTDCDLKELGIQSAESRRQILAAISEMNANKDRERQLYQKIMASFNSTLQP